MNEPNQAKRDIRAFERWRDQHHHEWPAGLCELSARALLALKTLDQPKVPPVMVRMAADDMADFTAAYAAHVASKGA